MLNRKLNGLTEIIWSKENYGFVRKDTAEPVSVKIVSELVHKTINSPEESIEDYIVLFASGLKITPDAIEWEFRGYEHYETPHSNSPKYDFRLYKMI